MMDVFLCPPDDLASKANIIIDPAEIQATSMDDLDEDEESGAAQVLSISEHTTQPRHHVLNGVRRHHSYAAHAALIF